MAIKHRKDALKFMQNNCEVHHISPRLQGIDKIHKINAKVHFSVLLWAIENKQQMPPIDYANYPVHRRGTLLGQIRIYS